MDIITFIIIAIFIYSIFAKKNKPPQRGQRGVGDNQIPAKPLVQTTRKKGSIFENLERQMRESAEKFEKELQGEKPVLETRTTTETKKSREYVETEGEWGQEGRSEYDKYVSVQGTQGVEGASEKSPVEQAEIGVTPIFSEPQAAGSLKFSSSSIIDGVIWAEILKEPKGKRAFTGR